MFPPIAVNLYIDGSLDLPTVRLLDGKLAWAAHPRGNLVGAAPEVSQARIGLT